MEQRNLSSKVPFVILTLLGIAGIFYLKTADTSPKQTITVSTRNETTETTSTSEPTTDPSAKWATFTSNTYGFSFKYPDGYKVEERTPGFFVITSLDEHVPQGGISIDARLNEPYNTLSSAETSIKSSLDVTQNISVNSWQVYQGISNEEMIKGIEFRQAITPFKTGVIRAETIATSSYVNIFDQILSTFKFIQG